MGSLIPSTEENVAPGGLVVMADKRVRTGRGGVHPRAGRGRARPVPRARTLRGRAELSAPGASARGGGVAAPDGADPEPMTVGRPGRAAVRPSDEGAWRP